LVVVLVRLLFLSFIDRVSHLLFDSCDFLLILLSELQGLVGFVGHWWSPVGVEVVAGKYPTAPRMKKPATTGKLVLPD
jgi:hypothetical protein